MVHKNVQVQSAGKLCSQVSILDGRLMHGERILFEQTLH